MSLLVKKKYNSKPIEGTVLYLVKSQARIN